MRCDHCGEVIGVYEPAILLTDGGARTTSVAADPSLEHEQGRRFHGSCFAGLHGPGADGASSEP
ncbi:hypothetical protein FSW04_21080 [Baekduia soli]|uniref:Uncharacterized protein n=1 Tax=Baekduia soli TaxID=496014 RepID=A0A5B8U9G6_9ACTN|nr:hypothetical protein [Baekduia soli]QEC49813.1 hypothetical protein FSW04_21080 [Baekduia soli]